MQITLEMKLDFINNSRASHCGALMLSNEMEDYEKEKNFDHPGDGPGRQHGAGWMWRQCI